MIRKAKTVTRNEPTGNCESFSGGWSKVPEIGPRDVILSAGT
jgi:hypothetical protein